VNPKIHWDELFDRISLGSPKKIKNTGHHELVKKLIAPIEWEALELPEWKP